MYVCVFKYMFVTFKWAWAPVLANKTRPFNTKLQWTNQWINSWNFNNYQLIGWQKEQLTRLKPHYVREPIGRHLNELLCIDLLQRAALRRELCAGAVDNYSKKSLCVDDSNCWTFMKISFLLYLLYLRFIMLTYHIYEYIIFMPYIHMPILIIALLLRYSSYISIFPNMI